MSGIPVPYSVAILGVNNDATLCDTSHPSLSSIPLDAEQAGYTAAHKLDALMNARKVQPVTLYNPLPVSTRDSTLQLQTDDPIVMATLEKIRKTHGFNLRVGELAAEAGITARTLENKFRAAIGRSVGVVIRTSCLDKVKKLVEDTDTPLSEIAALCGQQSAAHLADVFRRRFGLTMSAARRTKSSSRH
jgi:LacI family transcriptional regulator